MSGTIRYMFSYPNISISQFDRLKQELPGWGFLLTPMEGDPLRFVVSGYRVTADVAYNPQTMLLQLTNLKKTGLGKFVSDGVIDEKIRAALHIE
jgi:hypothetical protein